MYYCGNLGAQGYPTYVAVLGRKSNIILLRILTVASYPGHSQILSRSRGEKSRKGLGSKLRHGPEMVDLVST